MLLSISMISESITISVLEISIGWRRDPILVCSVIMLVRLKCDTISVSRLFASVSRSTFRSPVITISCVSFNDCSMKYSKSFQNAFVVPGGHNKNRVISDKIL